MRPHQWTKNLVIFGALIFSKNLFNPTLFLETTIAFLLFCVMSGSLYILNDIADIEKDKLHPRKKHRPLASGNLNPSLAAIAATVMIVLSLAGAFRLSTELGYCLLIYGVLVTGYTYL